MTAVTSSQRTAVCIGQGQDRLDGKVELASVTTQTQADNKGHPCEKISNQKRGNRMSQTGPEGGGGLDHWQHRRPCVAKQRDRDREKEGEK